MHFIFMASKITLVRLISMETALKMGCFEHLIQNSLQGKLPRKYFARVLHPFLTLICLFQHYLMC